MGKPDLNYFDDNFSPFMSFNYAVILSGFPDLGPLVSSFEIPERTLNAVRLEFMGKSKTWPGRRISSSNEVTMMILLNRKTQTYQQLLAIQDSFSEGATGNVVGQTFPLRCILYDDLGNEAMILTFNDAWLKNIGSIQLEGNSEGEILAVQAVFAYSETAYSFTGLSGLNREMVNTITSRLGIPVKIGNTDDRGLFPGLDINIPLLGNEPQQIVSEIRDKMAEVLNINLNQLANIRNVINTVRKTADGIQSKAAALQSLTKTIKSGNISQVVEGFKGFL